MPTESPLSPTRVRAWLADNWPRVLAHGAGWLTLIGLALDYAAQPDPFTFNRTVMLSTGSAGLALLIASFACTPLSRLSGSPRPVQVRRALGLYGFLHIVIHVWNYAVWENGLDWELIARDLEERRAMAVGLLALLALLPLAVTSTRGWQRRLGKRWRTLHRLVYVAVPLSVWHFLWLERDIITVPVLCGLLVAVLFALRLRAVRQPLRHLFSRRSSGI